MLDKLRLYRPVVWEYSRLNLQDVPVSKRRVAALLAAGQVQGWDDPRLVTIAALRRAGYEPETLARFVDLAGYSRNGN